MQNTITTLTQYLQLLIKIKGKKKAETYYDFMRFVSFAATYPQTIHLITYLDTYYPKFEGTTIDKKRLLEKLQFSERLLKKAIADLIKCFEEFILFKKLRGKELLRKQCVMEQFGELNETILFEKTYQTIQKQQIKIKQDSHYFYQLYLIEETYGKFKSRFNNRAVRTHNAAILDKIDQFFIASKLKWANIELNAQYMIPSDYEIQLLESIQTLIEQVSFKKAFFIKIHIAILHLFQSQTNEGNNFSQFKQLLEEADKKLTKNEFLNSFVLVLNYYIRRRYKFGELQYGTFVLDLYKIGINKGILDKRNVGLHFKNMITNALHEKDLIWANYIYDTYQNNLPQSNKKMILALCEIAIAFYSKQYQRTITLANALEIPKLSSHQTFIHEYLDQKMILIKVYYELNVTNYQLKHLEQLENNLEKIRLYFQKEMTRTKKNMATFNSQKYQEFINFMYRLFRILQDIQTGKTFMYKADKQLILDKIQASIYRIEYGNAANIPLEKSNPIDKKWLLEKVKALKKLILRDLTS